LIAFIDDTPPVSQVPEAAGCPHAAGFLVSWQLHGRRNPAHASLQRQGALNDMMERVAVLVGTAQFRLKVKVNVPEGATLADVESTVRSTIVDDPIRNWTLVGRVGGWSLCPTRTP
jgi:hypothetical protein